MQILISNISILDVIFFFLILFLITIFIMSLILIYMRINNYFIDKIHARFLKKWESKIFAYLESDQEPDDFLKSLNKKRVGNLLKFLRNYLNLLRGNDFEQLSKLLKAEKISNYFLDSLNSKNSKKITRAIYFLGIFKDRSYITKISKYLNSNNDEIYSQTARSLARLNATEFIDNILESLIKKKRLSDDTLYSILIEYKPEACKEMCKYFHKTKNERIQLVLLSVFTYFKYSEATDTALKLLLYSHSRSLVIQSMKYFEALEYSGVANALRLMFIKSSPEIISQAIRTSVKIRNPEIEKLIYERIPDFSWQNKMDAVNALYDMSAESREKLIELSENLDCPEEASIAKMVISERKVAKI